MRARALGTLAAAAALAGCTFGERDVPVGEDRPVVHAVLNPATLEQAVLVERTLTGRVTVSAESISVSGDPIASGGGVPITGARVFVVAPDGAVATAIESRVIRAGSRTPVGTGVYQFLNSAITETWGAPRPVGFGPTNQIRVVPGGRYRLRVELPDGRLTTGESLVPGGAATRLIDGFEALTFNRDTDTLRVRWDPVPGARTYALRIETPYGAFFMFNDSNSVALTGELRNLFAERLPRAFQAGFTQYLYVAAVDTNYFDYYRSTNSPFSGSGIINRLTGGIGLFGAYTPILSRALHVRANDRDPVDGRYVSASPAGPELIRIWVDARGNGSAEITGAYRLPGGDQYGMLGTLRGDQLRLSAVDNRDWRFLVRAIEGTVRGDTIVARVTGQVSTNDPGTRVFVRQTTP
jgi:hypothetical protein